jgi:hypothetical protein
MWKRHMRRREERGIRKVALARGLALAALAAAPCSKTLAAELAGITMPDTRVVDGKDLRLNGIGLRTYSFLGIKIYVAALYLAQRSDNAEAILQSPETKVLDIRFLRDVDAEEAHKSWRNGFANNCRLPECSLNQQDVERFISQVPAVHRGDQSTLIFTSRGVVLTLNGRREGDITDTHFAQVLLRTFLGPSPPTQQLKRELLGLE